jgi:hypothetical protein
MQIFTVALEPVTLRLMARKEALNQRPKVCSKCATSWAAT